MSDVIHGACLCGQVGFEVHEPKDMGVCHCTRCTRWTGQQATPCLLLGLTTSRSRRGRT